MKKILELFFVFSFFMALTSCSNYSEGERVGVITKFSNSGKVFKSYEGELKITPNAASQGMIGQYETFTFSIDNDKTIECATPIDSIKLFVKQGVPVVVNYQQVAYLNLFNNRGNTDYFVKSIIRAKPL